MAKKVTTSLVDDFDGSEPAQTVSFAFDHVDYEIDLCDPNIRQFREDMAKYIGKARRVTRNGKTVRRSAARHAHLQAAREWLRSNGYNIGDRGRVPKDKLKEFEAAQAERSIKVTAGSSGAH